MLGARFLPRTLFLGGALAIVVAAVVMTALLWAGGSPASAQDDGETKVPSKPTGLSVATEPGSLDVSADWNDVEGADDYLVRWRPYGEELNEGVRAQSSSASITVAAHGEWVVRVQACNDAGCGKGTSERFSVEPAPEPTPTPTPNIPNKPPVFDRNNIRFHTVLENYGPWITAGTYVIRDPENDRITVSLAGTDAAIFAASRFTSGNQLLIGLDLNATPDYESPADANGDGVYEVTIRATDANGSGETTELDVTVTVLDVDEAPVITGPAAVSFAEHSGSGVGQYSAADPEGETATLILGGTDAASFTFADGTLRFNAAPDYETRDSYSVTVTASDGTNTATLHVTITITDVDETIINFGPVVNDQAERYQGFTGTDNAPRGTLVSKVYDGIFSDPNGDELTYTVSVSDGRSGLVDTVYVREEINRVFIRLDAEDDWVAVTPALPKPLVTTVTLTATDPDGLSASVTGKFRTNWEAAPAPALLSVCDRTLQVRDALAALLGKACQNIGDEDLSKVVRLDLSNTGMRSLRQGDFSGMISLREVDVSSNSFTAWTDVCGTGKWGASVLNINLNNNKKIGGTGAALPGNCFVGAPNLKTLHLAGTRINSLPANAFGAGSSRLTNLWWLDLSRNQIKTLDVNVFSGLRKLWYLDLGRNELTSGGLPVTRTLGVVTNAVFDDLVSLEWLALNNQIEQDESNNFEPTGSALLTKLDAGVFTGLSSLKELDLANNGFTKTSPNELPAGVFTPLTSLESMALFGNSGAPWTTAQLITLGVRTDSSNNILVSVLQEESIPGNFQVEPGEDKITLRWDEPSGTGTSHQYRYISLNPDDDDPRWSDFNDWTDISSPTDLGTTLEKEITGLTAGHGYFFQIRSVKSGGHSWHANADYTATYGTSGDDRLVVYASPGYLVGLAGDDVLIGGGGGDKLEGGDGDDVLDASQSNNATLSGGDGDDTLFSTYGATLDGGDGTDIVSYAKADVGVTLDLADPTNNDDLPEGNTFTSIERYVGSAHADSFTGDANANVFEGGASGDTLDGAGGSDTVSYAGSSAGVSVALSANAAQGGDAQGDTISNFENILGSAHVDTLVGDGNANVIEGGASGDTLNCAGGTDTLAYTGSSAGVTVNINDNTTSGGDAEGDDITGCENITGSDYDDSLTGDVNANVLKGGEGNDTVSYASSNAAVTVNLASNSTSGGHAAGDTLQGIESLIGSAHADTLTGDANANVLTGGAGGDTLTAGGGDDTVEGGAGSDTLWGEAGTGDTLSYASSDAAVTVDIANQTASGGHAQGDSGLGGFENITGSEHADTLTGTASANVIEGGAGGDTLNGAGGSDTVSYAGSSGGVTVNLADNTASGGHAAGDTISNFENVTGSAHNDTLRGDASANVLRALGGGEDYLYGGEGNDTLWGGHGIDRLNGDAGNDTLMGEKATDELFGSPGADILNGGDDWRDYPTYIAGATNHWNSLGDWVNYQPSDAGVTVNLTTGTGTGGHAQGDTYIDIEGVWGSTHDDTLIGDEENNWFHGFEGADSIDGKGGFDIVIFRYAGSITLDLTTPSNNTGLAVGDTYTSIEGFSFTTGNDKVTGDATDNWFNGYHANDTIKGMGGNDILYGDFGADHLEGNAGDDKLYGQREHDQLYGGDGDDLLHGGANANGVEKLYGGDGNDVMYGEEHDDELYGGNGNDVMDGGGGEDYFEGGTGDDKMYGGDWNDEMWGGSGDDKMYGEKGYDELRGQGGDDHLEGGPGEDKLNGDAGDDYLEGGIHADTLNGGDGSDTVSYASSDAAVTIDIANNTASGGDAAGDTISNLENIIGSAHADTLTGDANANVIEGGAGGDTMDGAAGSDTVSYASSDAAVTIDIANNTASGGHAQGDTISNFENIIGSAYVDTLTGNANANVIEGGAGADTLDGAAGSDTVSYAGSSAGVTVFMVSNSASGGHANGDTISNFENIIGSAHGDIIVGDANANVIEGGAGGDAINGAEGTDTLSYAGSSAGVTVNIGSNTASGGDAQGDDIGGFENIVGSAHDDTLTGNLSANVLTGGAGGDTLHGGGGDDTVEGGAGSDTLWGEAGTGDTLSYASSDAAVTVDLANQTASGGLKRAEGETGSLRGPSSVSEFVDFPASRGSGML